LDRYYDDILRFDTNIPLGVALMSSRLRNIFRGSLLGIACGALFLTAAQNPATAGVMVGITPTTSGSLPSGPFMGDSGIGTNPPNMVQIQGTGTVTSNPSDVWDKDIVWNYTGGSISPPGPSNPGDKLCINEEIMLFSQPTSTVQVSDWHERLAGGSVPLGWTLDGASISLKVGGSPFPLPGYSVGMSADRREIWFQFPPVAIGPPGNPAPITLVIGKYIEYLGDVVLTSGGTQAQLEVRITEQPSVPEPGTFALLCLPAVWFGFVRRSRAR
jgi:hypothetical protein